MAVQLVLGFFGVKFLATSILCLLCLQVGTLPLAGMLALFALAQLYVLVGFARGSDAARLFGVVFCVVACLLVVVVSLGGLVFAWIPIGGPLVVKIVLPTGLLLALAHLVAAVLLSTRGAVQWCRARVHFDKAESPDGRGWSSDRDTMRLPEDV